MVPIGAPKGRYSAGDPRYRAPRQISGARSLRGSQQRSSPHVQIHQSAGHEQPVGVLGPAPVTDLGETKEALEDQERVFEFGAYTRLVPIFRALTFRQVTKTRPGIAECRVISAKKKGRPKAAPIGRSSQSNTSAGRGGKLLRQGSALGELLGRRCQDHAHELERRLRIGQAR